MSERTKKIVFAVFFICFSAAMGYGLYWMFFRANAPVEQPTPEQLAGQLPSAGVGVPPTYVTPTTPGELPGAGEGVPTEVPTEVTAQPSGTHLLRDSVTQAISPTTDGSGARFYNPEDGRFYRVSTDGTVTMLAEKQFFNVDQVQWGNKSDQAILEFPDGSNVYYDFNAKQQVTLPKHWEDFDFAPDDKNVAAKSIAMDADNRYLMVSNPNGTEARAIEPLGDNGDLVHTAWNPQSNVVAWTETGEYRSNSEQQILFVGQNHENFRGLIAPGQGFTPSWSPTGKNLLFSVWNPSTANKPLLWLTSGDASSMGSNRRSLSLNTWADKCAWASDDLLYCGVPRDLPPNSGIKREDFATLPDDVYRIDLVNGIMDKINTPGQDYSIRQPVLNSDKNKLMFSDAATGRLYSYDVK